MALKALLLKKQIDNKRKQLNALLEKRKAHTTREAELTRAIEEVETEERRAEVEGMVAEFESERDANEQAIASLENEIEGLENDLEAEEAAQDTTPPANPPATNDPQTPAENNERRNENMQHRDTAPAMSLRDRLADIVTRDDSQNFLSTVRDAIANKRAISNVGVLIPDIYLPLIRTEIARASRLLPFVQLRALSGEAVQNIAGSIPEAVWTDCCANLNEISLGFNQIEAGCHKVGAYMAICNATLEDADISLAAEIVSALGTAIAKALDKAILFGTGVKMPLGIVTRLAQTSQPADWGALAPAWTDLHTSNVVTLNIDGSSGAAFFQSLIEKLAIAKRKVVGTTGEPVWVMNRKTHLHIMAKALAFDANAALQANTSLMPIIGGRIVEFEDDQISDNEIIGGYFDNYLMIERSGVKFANSDIPMFLQDQTLFKATARYDGKPIFGEGFVIVNFANTSPTTTATFPTDWANTDLNELTISAAASGSNAGKTVLTVTDYLADSTPVLYYKLGTQKVAAGDKIAVSGTGAWTSLTSGTTEITAAAGKKITVVELNAAAASGGLVVSAGVVASVPKAAG